MKSQSALILISMCTLPFDIAKLSRSNQNRNAKSHYFHPVCQSRCMNERKERNKKQYKTKRKEQAQEQNTLFLITMCKFFMNANVTRLMGQLPTIKRTLKREK